MLPTLEEVRELRRFPFGPPSARQMPQAVVRRAIQSPNRRTRQPLGTPRRADTGESNGARMSAGSPLLLNRQVIVANSRGSIKPAA